MVSQGDVELSVISKNFFFTFFNFFLVFTAFGTAALASWEKLGEGSIRDTTMSLAKSITALRRFYVNYIILQGIGLFPFRLLEFGSVSLYPIYLLGAKTPRGKPFTSIANVVDMGRLRRARPAPDIHLRTLSPSGTAYIHYLYRVQYSAIIMAGIARRPGVLCDRVFLLQVPAPLCHGSPAAFDWQELDDDVRSDCRWPCGISAHYGRPAGSARCGSKIDRHLSASGRDFLVQPGVRS